MATGFGFDTSCASRLSTSRMVRGRELVAQAVYRRLTTPRGSLTWGPEHLAYGLDLKDMVGKVGVDAAARALPAQIRNELVKDDRISDVRVTIRAVGSGVERGLEIQITVSTFDEGEDFSLTLSVTAARTLLNQVNL